MAERRDSVKRLWRRSWQGQARRLALWVPVLIGLGIWLRFDAAPVFAVGACAAVAVLLVVPVLRGHIVWAAVALATGFGAAEVRLHAVSAPVLEQSFRGEVSGRVRVVDASASGSPRLTLDRVTMDGVAPGDVPATVRVSLRKGTAAVPRVGDLATVSAVLAAPRGPAEPGGFDFSRKAYFDRLGAIGYAVGAVEAVRVDDADLPLALRIDRWRGEIAASLRARIGGTEGAIAAALTVGDRSGIPEEARDALRDSGLAHLLAISGLHVGLLGGLVYWAVRLGLALPPGLAERYPVRKVAALCALVSVAVYLVMSGASVATQRAFIMAAVALVAILIDRAAVTLRGLAVAAGIILLARPESLFEAGFQMSFAATAALVAGYDATRGFWRRRAQRSGMVARFVTAILATMMTSVLAGAATAPFAAYHFNRLVIWGLPANLLATPLMGLWIMPCVVLAAVLAPFGLSGIALSALGAGIAVVIGIAETFGGIDGAVEGVVATEPVVLFGVVLGGLWLTIWRGPVRLAGMVPLMAALWWWTADARPDVFIARDAALIAGRSEGGLVWIGRLRAERYAAQTWLRRDGEAKPDTGAAYDRREWSCTKRRCKGWTGDDRRIVYLRRGGIRRGDCTERAILVAPHLTAEGDENCLFLGRETLSGASAITIAFPDGKAPVIRRAQAWPQFR